MSEPQKEALKEPNTEYRWAVRAENRDGPSAWVSGEHFTTLADTRLGGDDVADARLGGDDLNVLLDGVAEIGAPGVPGPLCVYGPSAFPVIVGAADGVRAPVVAAAHWSAGRVVALRPVDGPLFAAGGP